MINTIKIKNSRNTKNTINTIVLDIGQVLAGFIWEEYIKGLGYDEKTNDRLANATVLNEIWDEMDRSALSYEELIEQCCMVDPCISNEIHEFFEHIEDIVVEYDYASGFVKGLKEKGYRVYILSNYGAYTFEYAKKNFEFLKYVDGGVISYEVKQIKPEPEIYQTLLDKYRIEPTEAVFLDDRLINLKAAEKFGMHTIHFTDLDGALKKMSEMGIDI